MKSLENTCHIPERFRGGNSLRRGAISSACTFNLTFYDNFGKSRPLFYIFFSQLNSQRICERSWNYNYHLPSNLLPHYLVNSNCSTMLHSTVNSVQSDAKTFNYYFFVCLPLQTNRYHVRLKCLSSAHTHVPSAARHWSVGASIVRRPVLCQTFLFITEKL